MLFVTLQAQEIKPIQDSLQTPEQPVIKELSKEEVAALKTQLPKSNVAPQEPMARLAASRIDPNTPTVATGTSDEVGVTAGSLSVSLTGGAVYNMPIYAPPGINGVEPKISLQYNSQSGNGMAGWGWNVTGVSSISRVPATMHHDGRVGGVNLNMQDRFALDGQRLLLKDPTQTYGAPGTEYVTENYSNLRIIASSTPHPLGTQYGPASFTVYYPDGSVAEYGTTANTQTRTSWAISVFQDKRSVVIEYFYSIHDNVIRLNQIAYGHGINDLPINYITFEYKNRNRNETSYIGGLSFINRFILDRIRVFGSNVAIKNYQLEYNLAFNLYERLINITESNGDYSKKLNPTIFQYENTSNYVLTPTGEDNLYLQNIQGNNSSYISGDFNATGQTQIIVYPTTGNDANKKLYFYNNLGNTNNYPTTYNLTHKFEEIFAANIINHQDKLLPQTGVGIVEKPIDDDKTYFKLMVNGGIGFNLMTDRNYQFPKIAIYDECPNITLHCDLLPSDFMPRNSQTNTTESSTRRPIDGFIGIDDPIEIIPITSCNTPTEVSLEAISLSEYTLSWYHNPNDSNAHYEVVFQEIATGNLPPNNFTPIGEPVTVYGNSYSVTNIDPTKGYRFYVRKICTRGGNLSASYWAGPYLTFVQYQPVITYQDIPKKYISGDFNGDGITDLIAIEKNTGYQNRICNGDCFTTGYATYSGGKVFFVNLDRRLPANNFVSQVGNISSTWLDYLNVGDYNGNGKSDLYVVSPGNIVVYELNDNNILVQIASINHPHVKTDTNLLYGDYNGDGKTDILIPQVDNIDYWTFFYSTGSSFNAIGTSIGITFRNSYNHHIQWDQDGGFFSGRDNAIVLNEFINIPFDANHDGKTDIICIKNITKDYEYRTNYFGNITSENHSVNGQPIRGLVTIAINSSSNNNPFNIVGHQWNFDIDANAYNNWTHPATSGYLYKHPIPVFTNHRNPHRLGEFSLINNNYIHTYKITKNNQIDTALKKITLGNGIEEGITYSNLMPSALSTNPLYQAANLDHAYPYYCLSAAPSFVVVSQLERKSAMANHLVKQKYRYFGAISRVDGLGFQGFQATTSTNWYNETDPKIFTNHKKYDATKRGALLEDITIWGQMHPNPTNSFNPFVSKTELEYQTNLSTNKVYTLKNYKQTSYDGLLNTSKTTETTLYDAYNSPRTVVEKLFNNATLEKEVTSTITYDNNPSSTSNYYIGRLTKRETSKNNFTTPILTEKDEYDYNTVGLLQEVRKWGHNTNMVKENNVFDTYGNITQKTITAGGIGRTTSFKYDSTNRFVEESTDVEGLKTLYTYYNTTGLLKTETTPYGATTTYEYDSWGKKTKIKDYLNNINTVTYTPINNRRFTQINTTLADGSITNEFVDDLGRKYQENSKNVTGTFINRFTEYNYLNQVIKKSEPTSASTGQQWTNFEYDIYGRANKVTMPSGRVATTQYNGLTTVVNDGVLTTTVVKNALGLEVSKQDPTSGTLLFSYDANDKLKSTNYGGHIVTIDYDGWGRKKELRDPTISTTIPYTYSYNDFGEILTETTPNGTTNYNYNTTTGKLNNKTVVGGNTNTTSTYNYNPTTKLLDNMQHVDNSRTTTYSYEYNDTYKHLTKTTETTPEAKFEKTLSYDVLGRNHQELIKATHTATGKSAERTVITNYQNGQYKSLLAVGGGNTVVLHNLLTVNDRNQLLTATYGNGLNQLNQYSNLGFLQFANTRNASNALLVGLNTTFDAQRGNLLSRINNLFTNTSETFTYDNLDRLTHFPRYKNNGNTRINSQQDYDNYGRITKNVVGTYDYNTPGKRYQNNNIKINNNDNQYLNLNTRNQDVTYYVNKSPKTIEVKHQNGITLHDRLTFYNNGMDSRSRVDFQMSNRKKYYSADGSAEITQLASGQVEIVLFLGGDAYTAPAVLHKNASNQENLLYLHRDYLGSIVAITNQAGAVVERRHFDAWGQLTHYKNGSNTTLPDGITSFLLLDRGYTGHEHLLSVGLVHMNGRLYDPVLHRFLQPDNYVQDPMNSQNYNRYGYCWNNPLRFSDPSGEFFWVAAIVYAVVNVGVDLAMSNGNMNFGQIVASAAQGFFSGGLASSPGLGNLLVGQVSKFLPSINIPLGGDWNLNFSAALTYGNSFGVGFNVSVSYTEGDWTFSAGFGVMGYDNYNGFNANSEQIRYSLLASYDDGKTGFSLGTNIWRGDFKQRTGMLGFKSGDFSLMYENDGSPFQKKWLLGGILGDGYDSHRTAAVRLSVGEFSAGFNLFTGVRTDYSGDSKEMEKGLQYGTYDERYPNGFVKEEGTPYRLGALYVGYGNYRVGINSDRYVRHGIQDHFAHNKASKQPGFRALSNSILPYFLNQTPNIFTSW